MWWLAIQRPSCIRQLHGLAARLFDDVAAGEHGVNRIRNRSVANVGGLGDIPIGFSQQPRIHEQSERGPQRRWGSGGPV